ncbi:MAG: hypothetical protein PHC53_05580 [Patescibacteria group bacterium]|nr:hypothetical protein [Patescibacteria group bacterium]
MKHRRIWSVYPCLALLIWERHLASGLETSAHDFRHAAAVGDMAYRIALDEWGDRRIACLAGLAGLMHNADRVIEAETHLPRNSEVAREPHVALIRSWIESAGLSPEETETVIDAILKHSGKNEPADSRELIALRDADRVVNLRLDDIMRGVRHLLDLPDINHDCYLNAPGITRSEPGSVVQALLHDTWWAEEWNTDYNMRTKLGWKLAKRRAKLIKGFIDTLKRQLVEDGLFPNTLPKP